MSTTLLRPKYVLDCQGWIINGNLFGWNYTICDQEEVIAIISKQIFHLSVVYTIEVIHPENVLMALLIILAIDAQNCSANNS